MFVVAQKIIKCRWTLARSLSDPRLYHLLLYCMYIWLQFFKIAIPKSVRELVVESTWTEKLHPYYQSVRHQFDGSSSRNSFVILCFMWQNLVTFPHQQVIVQITFNSLTTYHLQHLTNWFLHDYNIYNYNETKPFLWKTL